MLGNDLMHLANMWLWWVFTIEFRAPDLLHENPLLRTSFSTPSKTSSCGSLCTR